MKPEILQAAIRAVPFRPFSIVLASGERFLVHLPDCVWLHPECRTILWCGPDGHIQMLTISKLLGIEMENDQC